jgi:hypothetical protein
MVQGRQDPNDGVARLEINTYKLSRRATAPAGNVISTTRRSSVQVVRTHWSIAARFIVN